MRGNLIKVYNFLMTGRGGAGTDLFSVVTSDRTGGNCLKMFRGGLGWISGKGFSPRGWLGTGTGSQGSGHSTKPDRVQEEFGQCSHACGGVLGAVLCKARSWT